MKIYHVHALKIFTGVVVSVIYHQVQFAVLAQSINVIKLFFSVITQKRIEV